MVLLEIDTVQAFFALRTLLAIRVLPLATARLLLFSVLPALARGFRLVVGTGA